MPVRHIFFFLLYLVANQSFGQLIFKNPSLEGEPGDGKLPKGWETCNLRESTPDILPGTWDVYNKPVDGITYIGLITRTDNTWETIAQQMNAPVEKDQCYEFSLSLSCAATYANYNNPVRLRVWGGNSPCEKKELLYITETVAHREWKKYTVYLIPNDTYKYLIFEPHYREGTIMPYQGNILIDNISVVKKCIRA